MTVKRLKDFDPLKQQILTKAYFKVAHIPKDGKWRNFKGTVKFRDHLYNVEFGFMIDATYMNIIEEKITLCDERAGSGVIIH